ncbi:FkbM family methyltransferase [Ornithinibacillus halophilus]|uniref:Methyltransferase, FkbM family n=1 Tax=Ornithinibacillus halophilus TaxID=930117 RepID=A0A1M5FG93_9BACI|nr:FkbM family methyltransferase [Ornithinibacillus halophilus]SHF90449.1 methyltransferase, FkbM family [Ornithinibacillus halophilus]
MNFYLPFPDDHIQQLIRQNKNFYEEDMLMDINKRGLKGKVGADVGANIGNHTIFFSKVCKAKHVYAFEPQESVYKILQKNLELNDVNTKVTAFKQGVAENSGRGNVIQKEQTNLGMSKVELSDFGNIKVVSLDDILFNKEKHIHLLKIDVEGMGLEVLKGARQIINTSKPLVYIEAENKEEYQKLNEFLQLYNYQSVKVFNHTPTYLFSVVDRIDG